MPVKPQPSCRQRQSCCTIAPLRDCLCWMLSGARWGCSPAVMWCGPWRLRGKPASPPIRAGAAVSSAVAGQQIELHGAGIEVEAEGLGVWGIGGRHRAGAFATRAPTAPRGGFPLLGSGLVVPLQKRFGGLGGMRAQTLWSGVGLAGRPIVGSWGSPGNHVPLSHQPEPIGFGVGMASR